MTLPVRDEPTSVGAEAALHRLVQRGGFRLGDVADAEAFAEHRREAREDNGSGGERHPGPCVQAANFGFVGAGSCHHGNMVAKGGLTDGGFSAAAERMTW